jgi:hypothetical protein
MNTLLERVNNACQYVRYTNSSIISFKKLVSSTRSALRKQELDVSIKTKKDKTLSTAEFYIMAYYDSHDDKHHETPIEVIVHHNFDESGFSTNQITDFLIQIFDATVHEFRHRQQSHKRNFKTFNNIDQPYVSYLRDPDEIDAYAFSIAIELLRVMDKERAKRYLTRVSILSKMKKGPLLVSPNLRSYIDNFGLDITTKKLSKKVFKHLDSLDKSKIFL